MLGRKKELVEELSDESLNGEEIKALEKELNDIIVKLAQNK